MAKKQERPVRRCALCHEIRELEESHIIPKFVFRHLRKTSQGALRSLDNPNKVIQDSEKHYLLCGECEDLFSTYETKFANKIFYPYQKNAVKEFNYDSDIYYFLTSVSWRSLYLDILDFVEHSSDIGIDVDILNCLIEREKNMREYLLKKKSTVEGIENHIFFFEDIKEFFNKPKGIKPHFTFHRGETSYTFFNKSTHTYATITNMMGIILFTLYNKGEGEYWENTELINGNGRLIAENQKIQSVCGNELIDIMKRSKEGVVKTSEIQKEKIYKKIKDNPEYFTKSKAFEALKKDFNI